MRPLDLLGHAHRRLQATTSIDALLAEVALFLEALPRERIEELAPDCRPRRIATQEDVLHWCRRLERHRMLGAQGTRSDAFRMVQDFIAHASAQASRLRPRREGEVSADAMPRRAAPPWPRPCDPPPS